MKNYIFNVQILNESDGTIFERRYEIVAKTERKAWLKLFITVPETFSDKELLTLKVQDMELITIIEL